MNATFQRAFTLIQLLITITIIGILASLLLPVLRQVREASYSVVCASNLRQLGLGLRTYSQDNRGMLPSTQDPSGGAGDRTFFARVMPYAVDHYTGDSWKVGSTTSQQILDQSKIASCKKAGFSREAILALGGAYLNRVLNSSYGVNVRLDTALYGGVIYKSNGTLATAGDLIGPDVAVSATAYVQRRIARASGPSMIITLAEGWAVGTNGTQPDPQRILYVNTPNNNSGAAVYSVPSWIPARTIPAFVGALAGDGYTRSQALLRQSHPSKKSNFLFLDGRVQGLRDIDTFFNGFNSFSKPVNMWTGIQ